MGKDSTIPRKTISLQMDEVTHSMIRQWSFIFRNEFDRESGDWPRSMGEVVEMAMQALMREMQSLDDTTDPGRYREYTKGLSDTDRNVLDQHRYKIAGYREARNNIESVPYEGRVRFMGEE